MILISILVYLDLVSISNTQVCDSGWFGSECQYKRHCRRPGCDMDGQCPCDSLCDLGWFGRGCQYVDLMASMTSVVGSPDTNLRQLTDHNDQTCLSTPSLQDLTLTWDKQYVLTWIRLYVSQPDLLHVDNITSIYDRHGSLVLGRRIYRVTDRALDIQFDQKYFVEQVKISGRGIGYLCSIYVSGGRNVALKQPTWQSSTTKDEDVELVSSLAVDGNTHGFLRAGTKSCSSTRSGDPSPNWQLKFTSAKVIYQIILHNRDVKDLLYRLKGFVLTTFGVDGANLSVFRDTQTTPRHEYVITGPPYLPVSRVQIQASSQNNSQNVPETILSLCEVEIFGDAVCPPRTFGFECELMCNCTFGNQDCFASTGGCPSDYTGDVCNSSCTEVWSDPTAAVPTIALFVGVGLAIVSTIIIIIVVCLCRRRMRKPVPQLYDLVDSNTQYNHEYKALSQQPETSNGENRYPHPQTQPQTLEQPHPQTQPQISVASYDSRLYEEVDDEQYVELVDIHESPNQL